MSGMHLSTIQLEKLQRVISSVLKGNTFYRGKLTLAGMHEESQIKSVDDYRRLPFTTKEELSNDQTANPPYGTNHTFTHDQYVRIHQTSGTTGAPLRWLDSAESWNWWAQCWKAVYDAAGVTSTDRIFFAFSFGPFIGFWSAYEGAAQIGALSIPGGGMTSLQRLSAILFNDISVLVCTPTYALHLAEVAEAEGIDIAQSSVRLTIHAGEPGASIPSTKQRIETAWGAKCYDHVGATEVGAWGFECQKQNGVHLNEGEFIFEVIDPATGSSANQGELVITNLGRLCMPVIRYRTGDHVKLYSGACECGRYFRRLDGGIIGRLDDALIVRGVNVYPSTIENIVRECPEVGEFAVDVYRRGALDEMEIRLETSTPEYSALGDEVSQAIRKALGLRVAAKIVDHGSLPRFELKARRFTDHRQDGKG
ncbi:MAG: phenylacetate--CoA ligase family protein [Candidatus Poribacteria bacterium]|nr:phenylacetate--CoA ligase family protein [Candidatus Poribacteria bacterium]